MYDFILSVKIKNFLPDGSMIFKKSKTMYFFGETCAACHNLRHENTLRAIIAWYVLYNCYKFNADPLSVNAWPACSMVNSLNYSMYT